MQIHCNVISLFALCSINNSLHYKYERLNYNIMVKFVLLKETLTMTISIPQYLKDHIRHFLFRFSYKLHGFLMILNIFRKKKKRF